MAAPDLGKWNPRSKVPLCRVVLSVLENTCTGNPGDECVCFDCSISYRSRSGNIGREGSLVESLMPLEGVTKEEEFLSFLMSVPHKDCKLVQR
jgi:hypothetical protein